MKIKSFAVLDTNVLVSSLLSDGFPHKTIDLNRNFSEIAKQLNAIVAEYFA